MNWIEKMIAEQCPNGVKKVKLGEVCDFRNGFAFKSTTFKDSGIPVIRITNIVNHSVDLTDAKYIEPSDYKETLEPYTISLGNILVAMSGATTGKIGIYSLKEKAYQNQRVGMFAPNLKKISNKFLYHYLYGQETNMYMLAGGGAQPNLSSIKVMESLEIPLPSLSIQEEIVSVLDKFSELIEKTDAEIALRQKQYEYYREKLLTFEDGEVEWKKLGDICLFLNGKGHEKHITENGKYIVVNSKFISTQGCVRKYSDKQISPLYVNDVLMVMSDLPNGRALARCFIVDKDDLYTLNQRICSLTVKNRDELLPKYLFYITNRNRQLLMFDNGVDQTNLRKEDILNIQIPIPSPSRQQSIVANLDKFETLISKLKEERELRQKQYEYYREKLLTF